MEKSKEFQYRYYEMPMDSYIMALLGEDWIRAYGSDSPGLHFHNYMEIGYCRKGTGEMLLGDKSYTYYPGTFTILPANFPHNTMSKPETTSFWEYLFVDVGAFLNKAFENNPHKSHVMNENAESAAHFLKAEENPQTANLILAIMENYRTKEELYKESTNGMLLALIVDIVRLSKNKDPNQARIDSETNAIVGALKFVEKNYKEQIKISQMAEVCHLSETHFRRVFGQHMGIAPLTYVNLVRVEATCRMMRTTDHSIKEIAFRCGFLTLPSFNRNFKALIGMPPLEWKKQSKNSDWRPKKQNTIVFNGWL